MSREAQRANAVNDTPQGWELIPGHGEAGDFVVIHNALNQAIARIQADSPIPHQE